MFPWRAALCSFWSCSVPLWLGILEFWFVIKKWSTFPSFLSEWIRNGFTCYWKAKEWKKCLHHFLWGNLEDLATGLVEQYFSVSFHGPWEYFCIRKCCAIEKCNCLLLGVFLTLYYNSFLGNSLTYMYILWVLFLYRNLQYFFFSQELLNKLRQTNLGSVSHKEVGLSMDVLNHVFKSGGMHQNPDHLTEGH